MKTLADVKRRLVPGTKVNVTNHFRPEASGLRTMERNQTANIAWRMPDGKLTWYGGKLQVLTVEQCNEPGT